MTGPLKGGTKGDANGGSDNGPNAGAGSPPNRAAWQRANSVALAYEVAVVRARLLGEGFDVERPQAPGFRSALDTLTDSFGLTRFERQILVLCAGVQIDADLAAAAPDLTFGTALARLAEPHWNALSPWGPLRYWHLIELESGPLTGAPLRVDEWVVHTLVGTGGADARLIGVLRPVPAPEHVAPTARDAAERVVTAWADRDGSAVIALRGADNAARRMVFAQACRRLGWRAYAVDVADLPADVAERETLLRRWEREAMYDPAALLVEAGTDTDDPALRRAVERFVRGLVMPAAVAADALGPAGARALPGVDVVRPSATEQRAQWQAVLGTDHGFASLNGALDRLVAQFDLDTDAIATAARAARGADPSVDPARRVWDACRVSARGGLDDLATRVDSGAGFDDLVLPESQLALLRDMVAHVKHRGVVYGEWGMAGASTAGCGITALFAGPSGTGKTLAAGVVANALSLDLYRIDLSQAVSKYIGETEKNLRRIFTAAGDSGAVLLFDEADALFGKRGEVRDSHDRYANMEVSYLLQAMEAYRGLAVLTTNLRTSLDTAFLRRLRFVVEFPFPGPVERAEIWRRAFPAAAPTADLRVERLAQLSIAGGGIRNIAVQAAFAAADAGVPIGMSQVLHAAAAEYGKQNRALTDAEIQGWR